MSGDLLDRTGLRNAAEGISISNPDAALLADLAAVVDLKGDRDAAYKNWNAPPAKRCGTRADAKATYLRAAAAHEAIELRVISKRCGSDTSRFTRRPTLPFTARRAGVAVA
jgi:hypothetical protein